MRLEHFQKLLNDLKHHGDRVIIFSDEKMYTVGPIINKQNDRMICFNKVAASDVYVSTTEHPASVMMLGVVASTRGKMSPVWFPTGYRLSGEDYLGILKTKVLPWVLKIIQQDGTPTHMALIVQEWMSENMHFWPKNFWPSQSPNLYLLNFSIWWHIKICACKLRHSNVDALKASVNQ